MLSRFAIVLAPIILTGCALMGSPEKVSDTEEMVSDTFSGELGVYLDLMRNLVGGDALTRSATFNDARDAAEYAPTKINRLSYALALSVPGHPGFDADAAASRLRALIASGPTLSAAERTLAEIQLHQVEQIQIVAGNQRQLEARLAAADADQDAAVAASLRPVQAENARLRAELEDAEEMLQAITNIEESLSESQKP
jgi:hypothetical protein